MLLGKYGETFNMSKSMKILVTGSDGYIGTKLTQSLFKEGFDVTGLDTGYYRSGWLFNGVKKMPKVISKDTRTVELEDLKGYDAIVHLAELSNDPIGQTDPIVTKDINHFGTVRLANLAKKAGIGKFLYYSSCSIYGASDKISTEESGANPLTAYATCKILNEKYLLSISDDSFSPTIMRNATVFGSSPRMRFDLVINNLSGIAWTTKVIRMQSDGSSWRPFIHVEDIARATIALLKAPGKLVHNEIFNIGSSNSNYQIKDIAKMIAQAIPDCNITKDDSVVDKRNYRVSFDKISRILDFKCSFSLLDGIDEMVRTYKSIDLKFAEFDSKNYTRIKQIQYLLKTKQIDNKFYWRTNPS